MQHAAEEIFQRRGEAVAPPRGSGRLAARKRLPRRGVQHPSKACCSLDVAAVDYVGGGVLMHGGGGVYVKLCTILQKRFQKMQFYIHNFTVTYSD